MVDQGQDQEALASRDIDNWDILNVRFGCDNWWTSSNVMNLNYHKNQKSALKIQFPDVTRSLSSSSAPVKNAVHLSN